MLYGEFIGLPGSGKTTIRKDFKKRIADRNQNIIFCENAFYTAIKHNIDDSLSKLLLSIIPQTIVENYLPSLLMKFKDLFRNQCYFLAEQSVLFNLLTDRNDFRNLSSESKADIIDFFLRTSIHYRTISNFIKDDRLVIFDDEGFVQRSVSNFILGADTDIASERENIKRYFEIAPLPKIVFYIECDLATCIQRMRKRRSGLSKRLRGMDDHEIYNILIKFNQYYHYLLNLLKDRGIKMIRVNSNNSPSQNVNHIVNELGAILESHRGIKPF